jgi:hypothetical protein
VHLPKERVYDPDAPGSVRVNIDSIRQKMKFPGLRIVGIRRKHRCPNKLFQGICHGLLPVRPWSVSWTIRGAQNMIAL